MLSYFDGNDCKRQSLVFEYRTHTKANPHPVLFVLQALKLSNELTQLTALDTGQLLWSRGKELVFLLCHMHAWILLFCH